MRTATNGGRAEHGGRGSFPRPARRPGVQLLGTLVVQERTVSSSAAHVQLGALRRTRVVPVGEPALGQGHVPRGAGAAARGTEDGDRIGLVGEPASRSASSSRPLTIASARRTSEPTGKPLRYQATCLRKSVQPCRSPCPSPSSSAWRYMTAATSRRVGSARARLPGEGGGQVAEEPRPAEAAAADDDAVAAGLGDHPQRVVGLPDVAVAEHRDVDGLVQPRDGRPVGGAGVELVGGAAVQRDRGGALVLRRSGPRRGR